MAEKLTKRKLAYPEEVGAVEDSSMGCLFEDCKVPGSYARARRRRVNFWARGRCQDGRTVPPRLMAKNIRSNIDDGRDERIVDSTNNGREPEPENMASRFESRHHRAVG